MGLLHVCGADEELHALNMYMANGPRAGSSSAGARVAQLEKGEMIQVHVCALLGTGVLAWLGLGPAPLRLKAAWQDL